MTTTEIEVLYSQAIQAAKRYRAHQAVIRHHAAEAAALKSALQPILRNFDEEGRGKILALFNLGPKDL